MRKISQELKQKETGNTFKETTIYDIFITRQGRQPVAKEVATLPQHVGHFIDSSTATTVTWESTGVTESRLDMIFAV